MAQLSFPSGMVTLCAWKCGYHPLQLCCPLRRRSLQLVTLPFHYQVSLAQSGKGL